MRVRIAIWMRVAAVVTALFLWTDESRARVEDEIAELRREVAEIKKDVEEIKNLLTAALRPQRPPNLTAEVAISGRPSLGREDAP